MNDEKPTYYAIIPANVRYDDDLKDKSKLLYGEITALSNKDGVCWASDSYFAELYKVDKSTIQRLLKNLEDKHYITRKVIYKEGTREIEHRYMQICEEAYMQNCEYPIRKNEGDNITSINNTSINNKKNNIKRKFYPNCNHVMFTDEELEKLKQEFPNDWEQRIQNVEDYCASKGKKYKDYLATIRMWARKEKPNTRLTREEVPVYDASNNPTF